MTTPLQTPEQIYQASIQGCARSTEWKVGVLAGLNKGKAPHVRQISPYTSGTAQDDAWAAGLQYGLQLWKWNKQDAAA